MAIFLTKQSRFSANRGKTTQTRRDHSREYNMQNGWKGRRIQCLDMHGNLLSPSPPRHVIPRLNQKTLVALEETKEQLGKFCVSLWLPRKSPAGIQSNHLAVFRCWKPLLAPSSACFAAFDYRNMVAEGLEHRKNQQQQWLQNPQSLQGGCSKSMRTDNLAKYLKIPFIFSSTSS